VSQVPLFPVSPRLAYDDEAIASSLSRPGEIRGFVEVGWSVGVTARRCSPACFRELERVPAGRRILVDSGAVLEVDRATGVLRKEITHANWLEILAFYDRVAHEVADPTRMIFVAPDRIRSQVLTLERIERYAPRMKALHRLGAEVLVALQPGPMPLATLYRAIRKRLGFTPVPAFPMGRQETRLDLAEACVRDLRPDRVHLLGQGPASRYGVKARRILHRALPGVSITLDSYPLRALKERTGRVRVFTAAEDQAREDLRCEAFHETMDQVTGERFDATEIFYCIESWMPAADRVLIGLALGLEEREFAAWVKDPSGFLSQVVGDGGVGYSFDYRLLDWKIEEAWSRYVVDHAKEERIRRAVGKVFGA
jgi:hypothetical protein